MTFRLTRGRSRTKKTGACFFQKLLENWVLVQFFRIRGWATVGGRSRPESRVPSPIFQISLFRLGGYTVILLGGYHSCFASYVALRSKSSCLKHLFGKAACSQQCALRCGCCHLRNITHKLPRHCFFASHVSPRSILRLMTPLRWNNKSLRG